MRRVVEMIHELRDYIKSAPAAPGFDEVMLPGEPDHRTREERLKHGIPIDDTTWSQIEAAAASVGVVSGKPQ
jgi:uncharacterized oxidoreductase